MKDELENRFPIPPLGSSKASSFDLKPKAVDRWLEQLPLASGGKAAEVMLSAIEQVNSHDFDLEERLHFLDGLSEKVSTVSTWLRGQYLSRNLPLTAPVQAVAHLDYRLMVGMGLGYRIALARTPDRGIKGFLSRKKLERLPNTILGYLASASLVIEECALNYPEGIWNRMHALYQFCVQRKLQCIAAPPSGRIGNTSAEATYKGVLLLSLAGVHQFPRLEADQVVALVLRGGKEASLRPPQSGESAIIVDVESDAPPVHSSRKPMRGERLLTLDTGTVTASMNTQLAANFGLSSYTVARLRNRWSPAPDRMHPRLQTDKRVRLVAGLTSVHRYLTAVNEPAAPRVIQMQSAMAEALAGEDLPDEMTEPASDRDDRVPAPDTRFTETYILGLPANTWSRYLEDFVEPATCSLVDISPGGYRLRLGSDPKIPLKLGDIVATQAIGDSDEEVGRWPIGIVRWVSTQGEQSECGIQLISPYAVPVHAKREGTEALGPPVEGLLLPCASSERTLCTILLPGPHLKDGESLEIHYGPNVRGIKLGRIQDHGHGFTAYAFTDTA